LEPEHFWGTGPHPEKDHGLQRGQLAIRSFEEEQELPGRGGVGVGRWKETGINLCVPIHDWGEERPRARASLFLLSPDKGKSFCWRKGISSVLIYATS
jgi:hypothetical protein